MKKQSKKEMVKKMVEEGKSFAEIFNALREEYKGQNKGHKWIEGRAKAYIAVAKRENVPGAREAAFEAELQSSPIINPTAKIQPCFGDSVKIDEGFGEWAEGLVLGHKPSRHWAGQLTYQVKITKVSCAKIEKICPVGSVRYVNPTNFIS